MAGTYAIPVSCKGIVFEDKQVWLRLNERSEWELPGGRLTSGEQPEACVVRGVRDELGVEVEAKQAIATHVHKVLSSFDEAGGVLVAMYRCDIVEGTASPASGGEFRKFEVADLGDLPMPVFYKQAIRLAAGKKLKP